MAASSAAAAGFGDVCLQNFKLYKSASMLYLLGHNNSRLSWRLLKIGQNESSELKFDELPHSYSESECTEILRKLGSSKDGLKFLTNCYGVIGLIRFLGPYYMLIITGVTELGSLFGHKIYKVTKFEMVELSFDGKFNSYNLKDEERYKRLFHALNLTRDFFFSYSYHIMRSLQKNLSEAQDGHAIYNSIFVWNEYVTREIRNHLGSTIWIVPLIHGFFKQDKLSIAGKEFVLVLIARRSRLYAGTRYLKRGVNEKGNVANDVETEQIVFENTHGGIPTEVSSVVQNRGSIPLYWSQETSKLNLKPDITVHRKDINYNATRRHFKSLKNRYGNPIIVLNLIKKHEKRPRESILHNEFSQALKIINRDLSEDDHLKFLHWDLHMNLKSEAANVLSILLRVALKALTTTSFFYCQMQLTSMAESSLDCHHQNCSGPSLADENICGNNTENADDVSYASQEHLSKSSNSSSNEILEVESGEASVDKPPKFQNGVLRTNCIDCLDRTNVAQYAYGIVALGYQLCALGLIETPEIGLRTRVANSLMNLYENMGDTLSLQYGGSAAHNKVFSHSRGHMKFLIQTQEFFRTLQRYYSNAYVDAYKQAAIDLFLGNFVPHEGKQQICDLYSDEISNIGDHGIEGNSRLMNRTESNGSTVSRSCMSLSDHNLHTNEPQNAELDSMRDSGSKGYVSYSRHRPSQSDSFCISANGIEYTNDSGDSNFFDVSSLSSACNSSGNWLCNPEDLSGRFVQWVHHGETFWF